MSIPSQLGNPHEGRIKSFDCRKCGAKQHEGCKRFEKEDLKGLPVVCPRGCPPYYGAGTEGRP